MFAATAVKTRARIDAALEKLRQLKPNDPAFNVKVRRPIGASQRVSRCVDLP
jgi:hypothetical protein